MRSSVSKFDGARGSETLSSVGRADYGLACTAKSRNRGDYGHAHAPSARNSILTGIHQISATSEERPERTLQTTARAAPLRRGSSPGGVPNVRQDRANTQTAVLVSWGNGDGKRKMPRPQKLRTSIPSHAQPAGNESQEKVEMRSCLAV